MDGSHTSKSHLWPRQSGDRIALVVLLVQSVVTLAVVWNGSLYQDDIRAIIFISGLPFSESLLWTNATHVVPGTHAILWAHGRWFGLDYMPVVVIIPLLRLVSSFAVWRMLRKLFGADPRIACVFAFSALTPMALSATAWYAQALTLLPVQLATALAVSALSAYHETHRLRHVLATAGAVVLGLCFAEKTIVLFAFLPVVYCLAIARVDTLRAGLEVLVGSARVWAGLGVVGVAWVLTYTSSGGMDGHPVTMIQATSVALDHLWLGFLPTLVGGPWEWRLRGRYYEDSPYFAVADPPFIASVLGAIVLSIVIAVALRRRRRETLQALIVLLSFYVPCYMLVVLARGHILAHQIGIDLRFWADTVPAVALAASMVVAASARTRIGQTDSHKAVILTLAAGLVWLCGMTVTVGDFAHGWHQNKNQAFLGRLEGDLAALNGGTGIYETQLSRRVLSTQFGAEASSAFIVPWLEKDRAVGRVRQEMVLIDRRGSLQRATWLTESSGQNGRGCGWDLASGKPEPVRISLNKMLPARRNQSVLVEATTAGASKIGIEVLYRGDWWQVVRQSGVSLQWRMPFGNGTSTHAYKLPSTLPVEAIRLTRLAGSGPLCVSRVDVGRPVPVPLASIGSG